MKRAFTKILTNPVPLILVTLLIKIPMFFTKNIQEDSFITWRVARNLLNYGVIGFNGEERISASTTHLYVAISAFFQALFGSVFIYPLLIFSSFLFAVGSFWLSKILFRHDLLKRGFFVVLLNMAPPSLTASCLGMEYGILFFLYNGLIYYGFHKGKSWAYFIFPVLLLWTRIDTVIFLGVFFLADLTYKKRLNIFLILGGIFGLASVVSFNYLYFDELVNHTITAKKIAYKNLIQNNSLDHLLYQWAYYGGLIKFYGIFSLLIFLAFLGFLLFVSLEIWKDKVKTTYESKVILNMILTFAVFKISAFTFLKAYFDWYYWIPRVFLFAVVLYFLLHFIRLKRQILVPALFIFFTGLYFFQLIQSFTIGYMEERQRMQIAEDIKKEGVQTKQSIFLEPAGIIPFYTGLYTFDEVGLVNKRINDEMLKDENYWWSNSVEKFHPNFILTVAAKPGDENTRYHFKGSDAANFRKKYRLVKEYSIAEIHDNAPSVLRMIYKLRPIGKDYFLYKIQNQ